MWFSSRPCLVCQAKDAHLAELQSQVAYLRALASPGWDKAPDPVQAKEDNALLSGNTDPDSEHTAFIQQEASSILLGTYDDNQTETQ